VFSLMRAALVAVIAVAIALVAFVYRFNTPEGSIGGFTNDQFAHLMRAEMMLRGQQPLRDFADAELRGAWPALSYAVPAWAQQIGGRTLLPEACVTIGALAIAHAVFFVLMLGLSKRWWVAFLATTLAILTAPRPYSYPKVLMLTLGIGALRLVVARPSPPAFAVAALVTAVATLFRHDCGVYVAAGIVAGIVALDTTPRIAGRRLGVYAAFTALWLLPSAIWVQVYEGIPSYIGDALATAANESNRTRVEVPALWSLTPATADGLVGLTYYAFWLMLAVAVAVLALGSRRTSLNAVDRATACGLLAMAALANHFLLRGSLSQRLGDAVIPVAALAAWSIMAASGLAPSAMRRLAIVVPAALLVFMLTAAVSYGGVTRRLDESGLAESWARTASRFTEIRSNLQRLPPEDWSTFRNDSSLPQAARYVAECTSPDDYLMVAAEAPEIYVFAHRRFAAGQGALSMGLYTSQDDQRRALSKLAGQSVPIVLADASRYQSEFIWTYPLLAKHIGQHYRQAGMIDGRFLVFVERNRPPRGVDPYSGLPCFL
jgi:hypothetical protein